MPHPHLYRQRLDRFYTHFVLHLGELSMAQIGSLCDVQSDYSNGLSLTNAYGGPYKTRQTLVRVGHQTV